MLQRKGGSRRKSRTRFTKHYRLKGKLSMTRYFQSLEVGDRVALIANPTYHDSLYRARFHGRSGTVKGTQGKCYKVEIMDGNKAKIMLLHPIHLKKL